MCFDESYCRSYKYKNKTIESKTSFMCELRFLKRENRQCSLNTLLCHISARNNNIGMDHAKTCVKTKPCQMTLE